MQCAIDVSIINKREISTDVDSYDMKGFEGLVPPDFVNWGAAHRKVIRKQSKQSKRTNTHKQTNRKDGKLEGS